MTTTEAFEALMPDSVGFRTRHRSEPEMIGHYPWTYSDARRRLYDRPAFEYEDLYTAAQMRAMFDAATERAAKQVPEKLPIRLHVSFAPGDWDTFFYGVSGKLTMEALTEIDASLRDADSGSLFDKGAGEYLLGASYFQGQYGFEGRCEIEPGWELWVESFVPRAAAIRAREDGVAG